ncbi:MAG: DUF697 domain-containing protein [Tissierellia bacterium]|nr:DUF697 domain-containing protein [Tissierellia bacterium]
MMSYNPLTDMLQKTEEELRNMPPVNMMLVGNTGAGKSTLINAVFREELATTGQGLPVTKHLRRIEKPGIPLVLYDTRGLELSAEALMGVTEEVLGVIEEKAIDPKEAIHILWYCINAGNNRIEEYEIEMLRKFSEKIPVILVLTQCIGEPTMEFAEMLKRMNLPVAGVATLLAKAYPIGTGITVPPWGLQELVRMSYDLLPEDASYSFINAQQVDIEKKAAVARRWAKGYIATTCGVGFVPVPFSDAAVLVPMQISMLAHITAIFGISMSKATITSLVASIGGTGGATMLGRYIVSNALKFIPGAGTVLGGLISGATAGVLTTALAMSYIELLTIISKREADGKTMPGEEMSSIMKDLYIKYLELSKKKKT